MYCVENEVFFSFFLSAKLAEGFAEFLFHQRSSLEVSQSFYSISEARWRFRKVFIVSAKLAGGSAKFLLCQRSSLEVLQSFIASAKLADDFARIISGIVKE